MIKYPSILPLPLLSSTSVKQQSNVLRTEMSSGRARQRQRYISTPKFLSARWVFKKNQAKLFEGFLEYEVKKNNWFLLKTPSPAGLIETEVRFVNSPLENYKPMGKKSWVYEAQIEIRNN